MSRAFTKERDDLPDPVIESHPRGLPVRVTASGRAALAERLARAESPNERERLAHVLADAVIVAPPADRSRVALGAAVDVHADPIGARRFTVVGEPEVDVAAGRISETSPLGAALIGARAGDVVVWRRPAGDVALTIDAIVYDPAAETAPSAG